MSNAAIYRKTITETLTFVDKPSEESRRTLQGMGFIYDSKSRQWFRSVSEAGVREESVVTGTAA